MIVIDLTVDEAYRYCTWNGTPYFSREGIEFIFDILDSGEDDKVLFDPIAVRCSFCEYESLEELLRSYDCPELRTALIGDLYLAQEEAEEDENTETWTLGHTCEEMAAMPLKEFAAIVDERLDPGCIAENVSARTGNQTVAAIPVYVPATEHNDAYTATHYIKY